MVEVVNAYVSEERVVSPLELRSIEPLLTRDWYFIAGQPAPAPHLAHPEGCAAVRIVLVTVPRVRRSCEQTRMDSISESYAPVQHIVDTGSIYWIYCEYPGIYDQYVVNIR